MKSLMSFLLGIVLTVLGAALFLMNIHISNFTFFYRYNGTNVTALLLIALCIMFVVYVVYPNIITGGILGILFLLFMISVIMSMKFYVRHITAFEMVLILATFFGGIGLVIRGLVHSKDEIDSGSGRGTGSM